MNPLAFALALLADEVRLGFGRYAIDPASSSIGFDGSSSLHDFTAKAGRFGGEARVDPSSLSALAGGTVWIETDSLDSGSKGRDEDMKELLESTHHPRITFALDGAEGWLDGWRGDLKLRGRFTVRGVEKERVAAARIEPLPEGFRAVGEIRFKMSEHGIKPPRVLLVKTADEVRVWFDLAFRRVPAEDLSAVVRSIETRERAEMGEGSEGGKRETTRLWSAGDRLLWERPGGWWVGSPDGVVAFLPGSAAGVPPPATAEDAFRPVRERLGSDRGAASSRPAGTGGEALPDLERSLRFAPPEGEAEVEREGKVVRVLLGGEEWVLLEGLEGTERFAPLLAAFPGLPSAVRTALGSVQGIPDRVALTTASPEGRRRVRMRLGEPEQGTLPDWAVEPERWTQASRKAR